MMPISQRGKLGGGVVRETETSMRTRKPRVWTIPPPASAAPASGAPSAPVPRNPASSGEPPGGAEPAKAAENPEGHGGGSSNKGPVSGLGPASHWEQSRRPASKSGPVLAEPCAHPGCPCR